MHRTATLVSLLMLASGAEAKTPGDDRSFIERPAGARDPSGRPVGLRLDVELRACEVRFRLTNTGAMPIKLLLNHGTALAPELDAGDSPFHFEVDGERLGMPASRKVLVRTLASRGSHAVRVPSPDWGIGERMRVVYSATDHVGLPEKLCADCFRGQVDGELVDLKKRPRGRCPRR